jgi:hypothetical protein
VFTEQKFDVYEGKKVNIALIEAGQDSQGEHTLNRILARSKLATDEVANRIKDHRYQIEDQIKRADLPNEITERVMRAWDRGYEACTAHLLKITLMDLQKQVEDDDDDKDV